MRVPITQRALALLLLLASFGTGAQEQSAAPLPRVFIQLTTDTESAVRALAPSRHVGVRVAGNVASAEERGELDRQLRLLPAELAALWVSIDTPAAESGVEEWRRYLRTVLAGRRLSVLELRFTGQAAQLARFIIQVAATDARLGGPTLVTLSGDTDVQTIYSPAVSAYLDGVVVGSPERAARAAAHVAKVDPGAIVLVRGASAPVEPARAVVEDIFRTVGTDVSGRAWTVSREDVPGVLAAIRGVEKLLSGEVTELDPRVAKLRLTLDGQDVTTRFPHRLLFDNTSLATLLVYYGGDAQAGRLRIELTVPIEGTPVVHDVVLGERLRAEAYARDPESSLARADVPLTGRPMLVDFNEDATEVFADRTGVAALRQLTADEIIARHRAQQARQDAAIGSYIARVRLQQHFRPTVTDPGYDVVTENRYFVDRDGIEWEELSFAVNGSKWGNDRPPFPLLQPEKVLSLPLQLRFDEDYRYTLAGRGSTDGYDCYVISFEPVKGDRSLYRGTLWIDSRTFARVRVRAVQTGLSAPVVSNEEIQVYRPVPVDGTPAFLLSTLTAHQIVLIAGRNLILEKVATFESFDINPSDFTERRDRARGSDAIMYRETERGLRYFIKDGEQRVVSDRATTSAKAMAIGVTIDPSYDFPLPIFGINYLDFEFGGPDTQLAILFAGVLAAGNIQKPKIGNTPLDASVDFFAIAAPSNDRLYGPTGEDPHVRLLTWPLTAGGNLGWQYTPFQKAGVQYQFRFDGFIRDRDTAESFVPPPSTTTHGLGLLWEYRRSGYSVVLNGTWNRRVRWREWGDPLNPETSTPSYAKYTVSVSRDFVLGPFQKIHLDGAWFGGSDLDRLSRYQFGLFEATRIHGVPSSGLRFDDILLARGSYSFNVFDQYRLDLFVDQAWGKDETFGDDRQAITGIGAAVNFRTPWWGTLLRADVGKAFLPNRYEGVGSTVVQVMLQKPLR